MGSILQRQAVKTEERLPVVPPPASPDSVSQSSPSRQQENQNISPVENTAGYVQQGNGHGFAFTAVQSSALSSPRITKQEGLSLSPEQRARMDYHKAMALAKRKEKISKQQNQEEELLLNRLTPVQSTLSSQQDNHFRSTLPPHQANYGGTALASTHSAPSSQQDVYCGSNLGLANRHALLSHLDICGASTLASTHSATSLQHGSPDLHQDIYGSSILTSTYHAQSSQQDKHTALISVHNSQPVQQTNQGGLGPTSVQNPSSSQQGSHGGLPLDSVRSRLTSQQQIWQSGSAGTSPHGSLTSQHDGYVGSSLTPEQRAHMACEREKVLAKLKEQQKQEHHLSETGTSQCTIADRWTNFLSRKSYQYGGSSLVPVELSFSMQNQEDGGFSPTPEATAYIAQQDARCKTRLQQDAQPMTTQCSGETIVKSSSQQQLATSWFIDTCVKPSQSTSQNETQNFSTAILSQQPQDGYRGRGPSNFVQNSHHSGLSLTSLQGLASSQQDAYSGSSLTQEQRVRMAHQKEMAIARRKARLRHQQQDEYHHTHLTYAQCPASSQQDTYSGSSLTQEQRACMTHQKEMAIARCNVSLQQQQQDEHHYMHHKPPNASLTREQRAHMAYQKDAAIARRNVRLRQQQQQLDEHYYMHHKPPNSKQGTARVGMNSQEFATDLLLTCAVDCSQSASNQEKGASLFQQEGDVSPSPNQQISSRQDGHGGLFFPPVQSYSSSQTNSDGGYFFTPIESSLSSQQDSYGASFLALTQNGHSASSRETFSLCGPECASTTSMDQSLALHQCGAPMLCQQQVSLHERNTDSISLTPEQKAHMVSQKERALAKRKMILEQRQMRQHHVNQLSERQDGYLQARSPCSPVLRAGSSEYFSSECCNSLASDCCQIASQESQHIQK